jgi:hypothetical protein
MANTVYSLLSSIELKEDWEEFSPILEVGELRGNGYIIGIKQEDDSEYDIPTKDVESIIIGIAIEADVVDDTTSLIRVAQIELISEESEFSKIDGTDLRSTFYRYQWLPPTFYYRVERITTFDNRIAYNANKESDLGNTSNIKLNIVPYKII